MANLELLPTTAVSIVASHGMMDANNEKTKIHATKKR
jgi:hypothetical protein